MCKKKSVMKITIIKNVIAITIKAEIAKIRGNLPICNQQLLLDLIIFIHIPINDHSNFHPVLR
jgi:hypothetical protein